MRIVSFASVRFAASMVEESAPPCFFIHSVMSLGLNDPTTPYVNSSSLMGGFYLFRSSCLSEWHTISHESVGCSSSPPASHCVSCGTLRWYKSRHGDGHLHGADCLHLRISNRDHRRRMESLYRRPVSPTPAPLSKRLCCGSGDLKSPCHPRRRQPLWPRVSAQRSSKLCSRNRLRKTEELFSLSRIFHLTELSPFDNGKS